jgi:Fur family ferric uptake transcriptional regulator
MTPLEALFQQRGLRLTPCVREIHRRAAADHRIGIATVYRTLNSLVERGIVKRQVFPDGRAHYERAGRPSHPHMIDVTTGMIVEIDEADLEALLAEQAKRLGYRLVDFSLKLFARPAVAGDA